MRLDSRSLAPLLQVASELQGSLEGAQREHDAAQQALKKAYAELEKRISEHDTCVAEQKPDELVKVTLSLVHEAEETLDAAKARAAEAAERLQDARLAQRKAEAAAKGEARGSFGPSSQRAAWSALRPRPRVAGDVHRRTCSLSRTHFVPVPALAARGDFPGSLTPAGAG